MRVNSVLPWRWLALGLMIICPTSSLAQSNGARPSKEIAVTIDDLPLVDVEKDYPTSLVTWSTKLISSLRRNEVPAIGFVNEARLYGNGHVVPQRMTVLQNWLDAGFELGNHTYSHLSLNRTSAAAFTADIIRGEAVIKPLLKQRGKSLTYFRFPFLHMGLDKTTRRKVEDFLTHRGYTVAPVTVNDADWIFSIAYVKARELGDQATVGRIVDSYLVHMDEALTYAENLSVDLFGRNIRQILLIHASSLNADQFDTVAAKFKQRGYRFVTLEHALADDAFRLPDNSVGAVSRSWLQTQAEAVGLRPKKLPPVPAFVQQLSGISSYADY